MIFIRIKKLNLLDDENTTKIIRALVKASVEDAQNKLYAYISEAELLGRQIEHQKMWLKIRLMIVLSILKMLLNILVLKMKLVKI